MRSLTIATSHPIEAIDVTESISDQVADLPDGLALLNVPHTTAALMVCEADDELRSDFATVARKLLSELGPYRHIKNYNPNAEAHIMSAFIGTQHIVVVDNGTPALGIYQSILLFELDGPKDRTVQIVSMSPRKWS